MIPTTRSPIAPFLMTYFQNHLVAERNLSPNTLMSYRDALKLLLRFICREEDKPCTELTFQHISADRVRRFLAYLEEERGNSIRSRNQRLAAIRSFCEYVAGVEPQLAGHCLTLTSIPAKKGPWPLIDYLEPEELDAVFEEVDPQQREGLRDSALLTFMYNSGARVQEVADLRIGWLTLTKPFLVRICGKGRKWRICPLWGSTGQVLTNYLVGRPALADGYVFLNRFGNPLGRHGIFNIVKKYVQRAAIKMPRLLTKRISPHTIRHTTAMHLLQSGVEMSVISSWLGHSSQETTHQYARINLEMKTRALATCENICQPHDNPTKQPSWKASPDVLAWLESL